MYLNISKPQTPQLAHHHHGTALHMRYRIHRFDRALKHIQAKSLRSTLTVQTHATVHALIESLFDYKIIGANAKLQALF